MLHPAVSRTLICSALASLMIAATPGLAGAADAEHTAMIRKDITVRLSDLDLANPPDAAKSYRRIRAAAERVCGDAWSVDRECVATAVAAAVTTLNRPLVTALHRQLTGADAVRAGA